MSNDDIYNNKNHTKEEIEEVLCKMKEIFTEHLSNTEVSLVMLNQCNPRNRLFLLVSEIINLPPEEIEKEIIGLFKSLEVNNFCHSELDSLNRVDKLYCFKKEIDLGDKIETYKDLIEEYNVDSDKELLLKFKFKHTPNCIVFTMSYHFPTKGPKKWCYLF